MREISARIVRGRFWLENQDFVVSVWAIEIIFETHLFRLVLGLKVDFFRKVVPSVQGRRNGRGKKLFTLLGTKSE